MKKILVVTTFNNHFRFFYRLSLPLNKLGFETHFVTNKLSIFREAKEVSSKIYLLKRLKNFDAEVDVTKSFEVAANSLSVSEGKVIATSVWRQLDEINKIYKYDYIFLWGGVRLIELTTAEFAKKSNIKTLFFELGNFPNKIFVDPKGTNARSLLAEKTEILDSFPYNLLVFREWSKNYISKSLKTHSVPQSSSAVNVEYIKNIYDLLGFRFRNLIQNESIITKEKIIGKYLRKIVKLKFDEVDLCQTDYLFFPMQVNKDAQLILNSDIGNIDALNIANELAKEKGIELLVKPHPGEVEFGFIKSIGKLKNQLGFKFVNYNTIELILNSKEVLTINSTVGLQAKIMSKKVTCLGKAFYENFDENRLAAYLQSYLIDADLWNNKQIEIAVAESILNRAEIN